MTLAADAAGVGLAGGLGIGGEPRLGRIGRDPLVPANDEQHIAERKARALLAQKLDRVQRGTYYKHGFFWTKGKSGESYKIGPSRTELMAANGACCCVGSYNVPVADSLLALKMAIENDDGAVLAKANAHRPYGGGGGGAG